MCKSCYSDLFDDFGYCLDCGESSKDDCCSKMEIIETRSDLVCRNCGTVAQEQLIDQSGLAFTEDGEVDRCTTKYTPTAKGVALMSDDIRLEKRDHVTLAAVIQSAADLMEKLFTRDPSIHELETVKSYITSLWTVHMFEKLSDKEVAKESLANYTNLPFPCQTKIQARIRGTTKMRKKMPPSQDIIIPSVLALISKDFANYKRCVNSLNEINQIYGTVKRSVHENVVRKKWKDLGLKIKTVKWR